MTEWRRGKGVYYEFNKNRPTRPFILRWSVDGFVRSQSFATEEDREIAARSLTDKREDHGREILTFDPREWRRWLSFLELAGDTDPLLIVREWQAFRTDKGLPTASINVADAVAQYITFRAEGKLSADTRRHIEKHVRDRFGAYFAGEKLRDVTAGKIGDWLKSLRVSRGDREGEPVEALTRRHHRKDVNTFFDFCVTKGWLAKNPCELVAVPHVEEEDVELMTVEEGRRLFAANEDRPVVGRMALEAFGFLRASRAGLLPREHINFDERGIMLRGEGRKGSKARFRQGHPDNLWAWLNRAPDETWGLTGWRYRNEKRNAFVRAGLDGSDNRLRKTCLSAHLAWLKNQPLTSYLAQHRHATTTDVYLGVVTERDGAAWFQIRPRFC
jgi:hypothetical protein